MNLQGLGASDEYRLCPAHRVEIESGTRTNFLKKVTGSLTGSLGERQWKRKNGMSGFGRNIRCTDWESKGLLFFIRAKYQHVLSDKKFLAAAK
jgi:hypothetical protein